MGSAEAHTAATADAKPTTSRSPTQGIDSIETMGPTASAPASPGAPVPPTVKPSSDRISTRTRRRTSKAAGTAPPAVDYYVGAGGAPRPSARRVDTPPRVPRPRPAPSTAATPAPAASSLPTVPIPSDRDRAEPGGIPLFATRRFHLPNWMPLPKLLNCSSLIPSCIIHTGTENSRLSRRATAQCVTSPSAGRRSCQPTFRRATLRTIVPPFRTSRNWLVQNDHTRPTTTSSYSSVTRRCRARRLPSLAR